MLELMSKMQENEKGQALVEYALILSLISVVAIGALTLIGKNVNTILGTVAAAL
jgi:pilus assembly protein Flp/PilA